MKDILILIIVLLCSALLYIDIEKYGKNYLFIFVGILITTSIYLAITNEESRYISFLIIIIYVSALSIMFGFIIMLNPNARTLKPTLNLKGLSGVEDLKNITRICYIILISLIFYLNRDLDLSYTSHHQNLNILNWWEGISLLNNYEILKTPTLTKVGILLYSNFNYILKLFMSTIILFLALISLFFILIT